MAALFTRTTKASTATKARVSAFYDASRKVWHQTWVTNRGQLLLIEGNAQDAAMVLAGMDRTTSGEERHVRGIWKRLDGGVRETAFISTDGGKTWKPWFDLIFRPHK
jgi:DICT domain-containing protein